MLESSIVVIFIYIEWSLIVNWVMGFLVIKKYENSVLNDKLWKYERPKYILECK